VLFEKKFDYDEAEYVQNGEWMKEGIGNVRINLDAQFPQAVACDAVGCDHTEVIESLFSDHIAIDNLVFQIFHFWFR
jgi:hypothetical protein